MYFLSLAALSVLDAGPAGLIRAAHAAGFDAVGLRVQPLLPSDPQIVGYPDRQKEIEDLLAETGLKVLETGVFPIRPDMDAEALGPVLSFCHKIGARYITCPVEDPDRKRRAGTLEHLCDLAETCGLDVLVEFNPYSACPNLEDAVGLVQATGRENARLLIDALHLSRSGGKPDDLRNINPDLLALVHLCDANPPAPGAKSTEELRKESRTARLYPGEGSLWLDELLDVLPVSIPLSIEAPSAAHAHLSAEERAKAAFAATRTFLSRTGRLGGRTR